MEKVTKKFKTINTADVLFASTSKPDYEMSRVILLDRDGAYLLLEGHHCSCYGFEGVEWEGTEYTEEELKALPLDYGTEDKELKEFIKRYFKGYR